MSGGGKKLGGSLQYTAPETPSFLRALKAQVSAKDHAKHRGEPTRPGDQLDSLLSTSSATLSTDHTHAHSSDDDENDGAQIVVLNDQRHLTAQQAQEAKLEAQHRALAPPPKELKAPATASGQPHTTKRRRDPIIVTQDSDPTLLSSAIQPTPTSGKKAKTSSTKSDGGTLEDVKALLRSHKQQSQQANKATVAAQTDNKRARKNKQAQTAKAKSGKGLSFSFDDE